MSRALYHNEWLVSSLFHNHAVFRSKSGRLPAACALCCGEELCPDWKTRCFGNSQAGFRLGIGGMVPAGRDGRRKREKTGILSVQKSGFVIYWAILPGLCEMSPAERFDVVKNKTEVGVWTDSSAHEAWGDDEGSCTAPGLSMGVREALRGDGRLEKNENDYCAPAGTDAAHAAADGLR